ncbi:SAM dependent methyltransferase [invertebrate metagenome]|uniref:SAM dependent methyltransferase n=1 Tax=invertebrate metagenome TaxID=1711999 RepID=A0A484H9P4_9ZZZZ
MIGNTKAPHKIFLTVTEGFPDYALLDSGDGRKLERFGHITVNRPEPQAMWSPHQESGVWKAADGTFDGNNGAGSWQFRCPLPDTWFVSIDEMPITCRFNSFCNIGVFPEQYPHWQYMKNMIHRSKRVKPQLLNLFGYTGVASLLAVIAGAKVTHVDASRKAIAWARLNQSSAGLDRAPIRWILDDARKFTAREVRRQHRYYGVLLDPPKFGRGPGGEVWNLFQDLPALLQNCEHLLEDEEAFLMLTTYAVRASSLSFDCLIREILAARGGHFESGELLLREVGAGRVLSTSLFTRWRSNGLRS